MTKRYELVGLTRAELSRCLEALGIADPETDFVWYSITGQMWAGEIEEEETAPDPGTDLREALVHAVSVIQTWHNMEIPERSRSDLWNIYWKNAPEMKPIRAALTSNGAP